MQTSMHAFGNAARLERPQQNFSAGKLSSDRLTFSRDTVSLSGNSNNIASGNQAKVRFGGICDAIMANCAWFPDAYQLPYLVTFVSLATAAGILKYRLENRKKKNKGQDSSDTSQSATPPKSKKP